MALLSLIQNNQKITTTELNTQGTISRWTIILTVQEIMHNKWHPQKRALKLFLPVIDVSHLSSSGLKWHSHAELYPSSGKYLSIQSASGILIHEYKLSRHMKNGNMEITPYKSLPI